MHICHANPTISSVSNFVIKHIYIVDCNRFELFYICFKAMPSLNWFTLNRPEGGPTLFSSVNRSSAWIFWNEWLFGVVIAVASFITVLLLLSPTYKHRWKTVSLVLYHILTFELSDFISSKDFLPVSVSPQNCYISIYSLCYCLQEPPKFLVVVLTVSNILGFTVFLNSLVVLECINLLTFFLPKAGST